MTSTVILLRESSTHLKVCILLSFHSTQPGRCSMTSGWCIECSQFLYMCTQLLEVCVGNTSNL